jgi:hypothetical protein
MAKFLLWLVVLFVVMFVLRLASVAKYGSGRPRSPRGSANRRPAAMVRCVDCGVFLPGADAGQGPRGPVCGDPACVHRRRTDPS